MTEQVKSSRRSFLDFFLKGGLVVWAAGMIYPILVYIWPARMGAGRSVRVSAGSIKDFAIGTARVIQAEGRPLLVVRKGEEQFVALSAICTHLGCIVKWDTQGKQILCPCHAAVFSSDGKVVSGPPSRPLQNYEVLISRDEVMVKI